MAQILKRQHWAISYFAKMAISEPKQCKNHSKNDGQVFFQCRWLIIEAKYIREMRVISTIKDNIQAFENRTWLLPSIFLYPAPRSRSNRVMLLDELLQKTLRLLTHVLVLYLQWYLRFYLSHLVWIESFTSLIGPETVSTVCYHCQIKHLRWTFYQLMPWFKTEMEL